MISKYSFVYFCVILSCFWSSTNGRSVENGRILHGNGWEREPVVQISPNQNLSLHIHPVFNKEGSSVIRRNTSELHHFGNSGSENQPAIYLLPPPPIQQSQETQFQTFQLPQQLQFEQPQGAQFQQPQETKFQQSQESKFQQSQEPQFPQSQFQEPQGSQFQQAQESKFQQPQETKFQQPQGSKFQQPQEAQFQQVFPSITTTTENYHKNHNYNKQGGFVPIVHVAGNSQLSHTNLKNKVINPQENELNPNRLTQNLKNWLTSLNPNSTVLPDQDKGSSSSSSNRVHTITQASQVNSNSISNNNKNNNINITSTSISTQSPVPGQKIRRKVNIEKFRECVFFRLCEKSQCFHFGRYGVCTKS